MIEKVETAKLNKQELIRRFSVARLELFRSVEGLSDDQLAERIYDIWTVKDVITHFIAWDRRSIEDAKAIIEGRSDDVFVGDEDEFNLKAVEPYKNIPGSVIAGELKDVTAETRHFMEETGENDLFRQVLVGTEMKFAANGFNFAHHDLEHAEDINNWRRERGYVQSNEP